MQSKGRNDINAFQRESAAWTGLEAKEKEKSELGKLSGVQGGGYKGRAMREMRLARWQGPEG